jgi:uncharacterized membrane protein
MIISQTSLASGTSQKASEVDHIVEPKKVLFARNNGWFSPNNHLSKMAAYFTSEGFTVNEIDTELNESDMVDVDILIVNFYQVTGLINQSEKNLIESFVDSGGTLIMSMVGGGLDFGVSLASNLGNLGSHTLEVSSNPMTENLSSLYINSSAAVFDIVLSGNGEAIISTDAGSDLPNIPLVAISTFGDGKVIATATATIWDDQSWNLGGNSALIEKTVSWFKTKSKKVVFSRNGGHFSPSDAYSQMAALFQSYDYRVEEIMTEINDTVLEHTSILVVNAYQTTNFNQSEITAIEEFVFKGGGLIMSADGGGLDFGVKLSSNLGLLDTHTLETHPHPITANLPLPIISGSSSLFDIELNGTGQVIISTDPGSTNPNTTIIATNFYGEGKIMVSAVGTVWDDANWNDGGNDNLIENYISWFESNGVKNFVFTDNNDYFSPRNAYRDLAFYVAEFGYQTYELIDEEPTEELLDTTDILLINTYQEFDAFSPESEAAVENWVSNGGSLIVITRGISISFGLHVYNFGLTDSLYENDSVHIHYHPVSANVIDVALTPYSSIAKFDVDDTATIVVSTTAESNTPNRPIIAVNHYGQGRVMGCSVGAIWDRNSDFDQNKGLIKNYLDWISVNTTTASPWISEHTDLSYDEGSLGNTLSWTVSSYYPYYYQILLDDVEYNTGSWTLYPISVNIDGLSDGEYKFSIQIFDHYGRTNVDTVLVTVNEMTGSDTTTSSETSDPTTTESSSSTPYSAIAMIAALGIISILGGYKRRKKL